jgi:hypothetical protein
MQLRGIDFTCAPSARKPITVALGVREAAVLRLESLSALTSLSDFESLLAEPGPWLAGCDFPFGLPRPFVDALALGDSTDAVIAEVHRRCPTRSSWRALIDAWGNRQPPGRRLLHRPTDRVGDGIRSTSPLQTRYVPVGFMYYEGLRRLVAAGLTLPGQRVGDPGRIALEAYPGALARELIGDRSYKNDAGPARRRARADLLRALERGEGRAALPLAVSGSQRRLLLADSAGDHLDAVLALVQAAWAAPRADHGLASGFDPVEGWIVGARGPAA